MPKTDSAFGKHFTVWLTFKNSMWLIKKKEKYGVSLSSLIREAVTFYIENYEEMEPAKEE